LRALENGMLKQVTKERNMSRKFVRLLAAACVASLASVAMAQSDSSTSTTLSSLVGLIGPVAAILWLILFSAWGGFRWITG